MTKFLIAGIVALVIIIALLYLLPKNLTSPITNIFSKNKTAQTQPSPSARTITFASPVASVTTNAFATISPSTSPRISLATGSPRPTPTRDPFLSASSSSQQAALPGTGNEKQDPLMTSLQILLSGFVLALGWKLSKYLH